MGTLDAGRLEGLAIEADALDGLAAELGTQLPEGVGVLVDDGDGMTHLVEPMGQERPDSAAAEDDDVHGRTLHARRAAGGPTLVAPQDPPGS